jgi:hypothetical protein
MRFTESDVFGVYVAPMSLMMVAAWFVTIALRRVASRFGVLRHPLETIETGELGVRRE